MPSWSTKRWDRGDRRVQRCRLRLRDRTLAPRAEFALTDALRLVHLPGEPEGRAYYFRRVVLNGVPADGTRAIWHEQLQRVLYRHAASAVHGSDWRASSADAVYFDSRQEALEALLRRTVRREPQREWYWALIADGATVLEGRRQIVAIVEELRQEPHSWIRVAQAVFTALDSGEAVRLLEEIPAGAAEAWLREMGDLGAADSAAPVVRLSSQLEMTLARATHTLGSSDPRTTWLAALAVYFASPGTLRSHDVLSRALATLRLLSARRLRESIAGRTRANALGPIWTIAFEEQPRALPEDGPPAVARGEVASRTREAAPSETVLAPKLQVVRETQDSSLAIDAPRKLQGVETTAAGLFFLLNVIARLGIVRFLHERPALSENAFVARVLVHLAAKARIDPLDPSVRLLEAEIDAYRESRQTPWPNDEALLRAWYAAVRRWCRRAGRLGVRAIVFRRGRITVSRTELDVTMPLDSADIRIRRAGLDIDPGWTPWFGRVVRFHYTQDGYARQ